MIEDAPFLRSLLINPDDRTTRLVYADWLDDRADPRADYLRLTLHIAELQRGDVRRRELTTRLHELQRTFPSWWVAIAGGLRATYSDGPARRENDDPPGACVTEVAAALGTPLTRTDADGYELSICSGARSGLNGAVAYLESRSKWFQSRADIASRSQWTEIREWIEPYHDVRYHLRLRGANGEEAAWEPETYNPFFGCETRFLDWYGDAVVFIYREKHRTYIARFGFEGAAKYQVIGDDWVLDGRVLGTRGWRETTIRRVSIPELDVLPNLSETEARECDILPAA
jgi:uncharacterized protein (TIGR02996 family)